MKVLEILDRVLAIVANVIFIALAIFCVVGLANAIQTAETMLPALMEYVSSLGIMGVI